MVAAPYLCRRAVERSAVRRWFAPPVWLGLRCAVDLLLLCVSDVGDMPAVDGEAGITKSKAKCALSSFPRAPLRHAKKGHPGPGCGCAVYPPALARAPSGIVPVAVVAGPPPSLVLFTRLPSAVQAAERPP